MKKRKLTRNLAKLHKNQFKLYQDEGEEKTTIDCSIFAQLMLSRVMEIFRLLLFNEKSFLTSIRRNLFSQLNCFWKIASFSFSAVRIVAAEKRKMQSSSLASACDSRFSNQPSKAKQAERISSSNRVFRRSKWRKTRATKFSLLSLPMRHVETPNAFARCKMRRKSCMEDLFVFIAAHRLGFDEWKRMDLNAQELRRFSLME